MSSPDSNNASIQSHGSGGYGSIRRGSNDYSNGQHHTSTGATGYRHHTNDPTSPAYPVMPFFRRLTYGVGHVLNDLCSSMWFSYLLIYLTKIIMFTNRQAGNLIMIGQVCDGLATPFIGHESDSMEKGCFSYGRRKSWHLLGSACVVFSFPFLFMHCIGWTESTENYAMFIYYCPLVVLFQFGWAATQISHLSLIPELTRRDGERVELNAIRYAFTVIASITVYGVTWLLLHSDKTSQQITPEDASKFRTLVFILLGIGLPFTLIFHLGTRESADQRPTRRRQPRSVSESLNTDAEEFESQRNISESTDISLERRQVNPMTWRKWWSEPQFYLVGLLYMCSRLVVNISQVYLPMYITDYLKLNKVYIAIIPLVVYCCGFSAALVMRPINKLLGRKLTYLLGGAFVSSSLIWFWIITETTKTYESFIAAGLLGAGCSVVLVTSLSITADLIGKYTESGAFVYGTMGLTDKVSNGIAILLIQHFHPNVDPAVPCSDCDRYFRDAMVLVPAGAMVVGVVCVLVMLPVQIGKLRYCKSLQTHPESSEEQRLLDDDSLPQM